MNSDESKVPPARLTCPIGYVDLYSVNPDYTTIQSAVLRLATKLNETIDTVNNLIDIINLMEIDRVTNDSSKCN